MRDFEDRVDALSWLATDETRGRMQIPLAHIASKQSMESQRHGPR
jgi:hypothetical protein